MGVTRATRAPKGGRGMAGIGIDVVVSDGIQAEVQRVVAAQPGTARRFCGGSLGLSEYWRTGLLYGMREVFYGMREVFYGMREVFYGMREVRVRM
jgi:hypothetical protein